MSCGEKCFVSNPEVVLRRWMEPAGWEVLGTWTEIQGLDSDPCKGSARATVVS